MEYLSQLLNDKKSHKEISDIFKSMYPGVRGLSERSVKRFCSKHNMTSRKSQEEINRLTASAVREVYIQMFLSYFIEI